MGVFLAADPINYSAYVSYPFQFGSLLLGLVWGVWVLLNLWIWQKTKATGNLLMLIGSAVMALTHIMRSFTWDAPGTWIELAAAVTLSWGFFLSVRPMVEAHLAQLRSKLQNVAGGKKDGPPPAS